MNDHYVWYLVNTYITPGTPATYSPSSWSFNWTTVNWNTEAWTYMTNPSSAIMTNGTMLIFEFLPNDMPLANNMHCDQRYNDTYRPRGRCATLTDANWYDFGIVDGNPPPWTVYILNYRQPWYTVPGGVLIKQYRIVNHRIVQIHTHATYNPPSYNMEVIPQSPSAINDVNARLRYQIGVWPWTNIFRVAYVRLIMPPDFGNPQNCVIRRGLVLLNPNNPLNPIQCNVTSLGASGWLFEFWNFTYRQDGWFIFDIDLTNPPTPRHTPTWNIRTIDNYAGSATILGRVIDANTNANGSVWVGIKTFPNLFRVYINTVSFENRRAKQGQWAEIHLRLITKRDIPPNSGQIQVWLPDDYNIPNGGNTICTLGNSYQTDLAGQSCSITADRKIYMNTDPVYGIPAGTCELVKVTTSGSSGGNNGFQMPSDPGASSFQIFMYNGTTLQEYNQPVPSTLPNPFTSYSIRVVDRELSFYTVVRFKFTVPVAVPAGYITDTDQLDPFLKLPVGTIKLAFNTKDVFGGWSGWPVNLGRPSQTIMPCKVFSGLVPAPGFSKVTCQLVASSQVHMNFPALVLVSNFQYVIDNSFVEIHIMGCQNPNNYYNNGWLTVGAYETFGDGSTAQIIDDTTVNQPVWFPNTIIPTVRFDLNIQPNYVGAVLVINFNFDCFFSMNANDIYQINLPTPQFVLPADGTITGVIDGIPMTAWIYEDPLINEMHFEVPSSITIAGSGPKTLIVSGVRNQAYADTANYTVTLTLIKGSMRNDIIQYKNNTPAVVATPNSLVMTLSSYFSGDVYV